MARNRDINIEAIIRILRSKTQKFFLPSVSKIAEEFKGAFFVLISCILSQRTKDKTTQEASLRLFSRAKDPQEMLKLKISEIKKEIYPVGFYHTKAKVIKGICKELIEKFSSKVPDTLEELLRLKGVGRKTANLVLSEGYGKLAVCVDTHVHRITNRLGFCKTALPEATEMCLRNKLSKKYWIEYNRLLVSWGQNICKPLSPHCSVCAIRKYCRRIGVKRYR